MSPILTDIKLEMNSNAHILDRDRDIKYIRPSPSGWATQNGHPRQQLLASMVGLMEYRENTEKALWRKQKGYKKLQTEQKKLLSVISYENKLSQALALAATNDVLVKDVLGHGLAYYDIASQELKAFRRLYPTSGNHFVTVDAISHLVRDWTSFGAEERSVTYPAIIQILERQIPSSSGARILVPGAGLGRLSYELADAGYNVVANDYSFTMALFHRYMLSCVSKSSAGAKKHTFHPYIQDWSNQICNSSGLRGIELPDIQLRLSSIARITILDCSFTSHALLSSATPPAFDAVITHFFIDTAENIVSYLTRIHQVLQSGGWWINVGPLLYGTAPLVELSLEEVLESVEEIGFELAILNERSGLAREWGEETFKEGKWRGIVRGVLAGYTNDRQGLGRNAYQAQLWAARKKDVE